MIKVLLVDDHLVVRNGLRLMLGTTDDICVAAEAETAREALLATQRDDYDVAIVDIALPDRAGLSLVKSFKARKPQMAVVVVSMYAEDLYAMRAIKAGASAYLTKNCTTDILVSAVRKAAAGRKYLSQELVDKLAAMLAGDGMPSHDALTDRELEVLKLIASGSSLEKSARTLNLSPNTITTYRSRIMEKMGFDSNIELARYAIENGLIA